MRHTPLTIHLTDDEREAIDREASERSSSRGSVVRVALRKYLREAEQQRKGETEARMPAQLLT